MRCRKNHSGGLAIKIGALPRLALLRPDRSIDLHHQPVRLALGRLEHRESGSRYCCRFFHPLDHFDRTASVRALTHSPASARRLRRYAKKHGVILKTADVNIWITPKQKEAARKAAQLDQRTLSSLIERLLTEHCQKVGTLKRRP